MTTTATHLSGPVTADFVMPRAEGAASKAFAFRNWFTWLVRAYARRYREGHPLPYVLPRGMTENDAARAIVRRTCWISAGTGFVTGATSTSAAVLTAQSDGLAAFATIPVALGTIGAELVGRTVLHLHMTLELGDVFSRPWNPDTPADLFHLYALSFGAERYEEKPSDPGRDLLSRVLEGSADDLGQRIGATLFGESLARNLVPFVAIASSSTTNWIRTRRLGDSVRRYLRYQRALTESLACFEREHPEVFDLVIEGIWFLFIADGHLNVEETATLANLLANLDPKRRSALTARFVDDELDWTERLARVPENLRDPFLHTLEVAAAVDTHVSLPERKLLRRAAVELGRKPNPVRVEALLYELDKVGVLHPDNAPMHDEARVTH